jgi:hypothetical protein
MVPRHGPLALHTSLRAHQLQDWISISMVRPLDDFQGPSDFHGHGSLWLSVKQTLSPEFQKGVLKSKLSRTHFIFHSKEKLLLMMLRSHHHDHNN